MDYRYLVNSGKYNAEDLNERGKAFIDGFNEAIKEAKLWKETTIADLEIDESIKGKLRAEFVSEVVDDLAMSLEGRACEFIVTFLDLSEEEE